MFSLLLLFWKQCYTTQCT